MEDEKATVVRKYRSRSALPQAGQIERRDEFVVSLTVAGLLFSLAGAAAADPTAGRPEGIATTGRQYDAALKSICPRKHLDLLSSSARLEGTDRFRDSLSRRERRLVDELAGIHRANSRPEACADTDGTSCDAIVSLNAIRKAKLLDRYVRRLCVSFKGCKALADCASDPHTRGTLIPFKVGYWDDSAEAKQPKPRTLPDLPELPASSR